MPLFGLILGGVNFSKLKIVLKPESMNEAGNAVAAVTLNYGAFIQTIIDFLIIAWAIFMVVKLINRTKKKGKETPAEPDKTSEEIILLTEI